MTAAIPATDTRQNGNIAYIPASYRPHTDDEQAHTTPVPQEKQANQEAETQAGIGLQLPRRVQNACQRTDDKAINRAALKRFLNTKYFADAAEKHYRNFPKATQNEYIKTLTTLLEHYHAGQPAPVNELVDTASASLDQLPERNISRNNIRDSFIPFLQSQGIITDSKPATWAYLDTRPTPQRLLDDTLNIYRAHLQPTPEQIKLHQAKRDHKAMQETARIIQKSRMLQEDIKHELSVIKREDEKCRKQAEELGVPYSKIKEQAMRKHETAAMGAKIKNYGFAGLVGLILIAGIMSRSGDHATMPADPMAGDTFTTSASANQPAGLSPEEQIWRTRYIELYQQNGKPTPAMEEELIALSGEYMLTLERMRQIVAGISPAEVGKKGAQ